MVNLKDWTIYVEKAAKEGDYFAVYCTLVNETAGQKFQAIFQTTTPSMEDFYARCQSAISKQSSQKDFSLPPGQYSFPVAPDPTPEQIAKDQFETDLTLYLRMKKASDLGLKVDLNALQKQLDIVNGEFLPDYFDLFGTGQEPV